MVAILIFFGAHWFLSLFFHTFFLHRYGSHQMYTCSKGVERLFYFSTWFFQGSSYLIPRAYGVMHRMHHEYSDTEKDPHSPHFFKDVWQMMIHTRVMYNNFLNRKALPDAKFLEDPLPEWKSLDRFGDHIVTRVAWMAAYVGFYVAFAPSFWWYLLLPIHFLMGPIQGATVNWCGHKYGYRNYDNFDQSKNSTPWGFLLMGELFQNNHHSNKDSANFARKWYEIDPTYPVMKVMHWTGLIKLKSAKVKQVKYKAAA